MRAEVDDLAGEWDRARLGQVVGNLLSNAIRYSPQGGPVNVVVSTEEGWAVVSVTDQGVGIAPADQGKLFNRYYRAGAARIAAVEGLGLGLYVSHGIIEQHGGSMFVQSKLGKGSTLGFRLPLTAKTSDSDRGRET